MADYDATDDTPKLSDTDAASSEDEAEEEQVETLVAGRERRKTAGNRYDRDLLLEEAAAEEEPDEVTLLFADNEEDEDEEFKSSDEEDDADMSSSDDDDQGPNVAPDDLEGEKEIQKQAKQERAKKRRADLALTSVAGLRKKLKTDPTRPSTLSTQAKPSKKKERVTWVHDPDSGRSSLRKQTIAHRAETIARLKESEAQSKKLKALKEQRDRERAKDAPKELTQADRLAEAARVERQNAKSLNRWETMEKKRQEEQAAKLAALKNRKLDGPVITWWSARAEWVGPKLSKIGTKDAGDVIEGGAEPKKRGRKSKAFLEQQAAAKEAEAGTPLPEKLGIEAPTPTPTPTTAPATAPATAPPPPPLPPPAAAATATATEPATAPHTAPNTSPNTAPPPAPLTPSMTEPQAERPPPDKVIDPATVPKTEQSEATLPAAEEDAFLKGIHEYATMDGDNTVAGKQIQAPAVREPNVQQPSEQKLDKQPNTMDISNNIDPQTTETQQSEQEQGPSPLDVVLKPEDPGLSAMPGTEQPGTEQPGTEQPGTEQPVTTAPNADTTPSAAGPLPVVKPPSAAQPPSVAEPLSVTEPGPAPEVPSAAGPEPAVENSTRNLVILEKFEELSNESRQEYSFFFNTRKAVKPVKHIQELCPITTLPVRYRDPSTGIGYANMVGYKKLQELKQHQFVWSSMLGCYVGRDGGAVARGVPEGFVDK